LSVRDLLTAGRTDKNSIQFIQETSYTNAAATVSETAGTTKPQSEIYFDIVTSPVTTIAHWVQATRQILDDVPMLQSYINGRLIYGLKYVEDNQLLNGGGTGTDLNGIYTQATASTANLAVIASPTKLDVLRVAILQASLANLPATRHRASPDRLDDDRNDQGLGWRLHHRRTRPAVCQRACGACRLSRLPAMTSGKFLTGAFEGARSCSIVGMLASKSRPRTTELPQEPGHDPLPKSASRWRSTTRSPSSRATSRPRSPI
jgi:hypothetical protein